MTLEQLIQAGVHLADLVEVDSHFTAIGIQNLGGIVHLKAALVALANVADLEPTLRATYKTQPEPSQIIKPLQKQLTFAKYLRNKYVGHIHPQLIAKAIEWQPVLRHSPGRLADPQFIQLVNLWLLETTINTYVDGDGKHKVFDGETDLIYPPDYQRFLNFLEETVRGSISYLRLLDRLWAPTLVLPADRVFDVEAAIKAGKTEFQFLKQ